MAKKTNGGKMGGKLGLAGVAAAAAAAAGAYYFYGSKGAMKNRAQAAVWMKKAEAHIMKEAKKGVKIAHAKISTTIDQQVKKVAKKLKR
jgi:TPR repeat protein